MMFFIVLSFVNESHCLCCDLPRADVTFIAGQPMFRVVHPHVQHVELSRSQVSFGLFLIKRHTSHFTSTHVIRHTTHVTLHTSHYARHTCNCTCTDACHHYSSVLLLSRAYCNMGDLKQMRGDVEGARRCVFRVCVFLHFYFYFTPCSCFRLQVLLLRCGGD